VLATHKGVGRRVRYEWTRVNKHEIGRFNVVGHTCGFVIPCDVRQRANISFSSMEAGGNSLMWTSISYL
jgi:hypothetical protein